MDLKALAVQYRPILYKIRCRQIILNKLYYQYKSDFPISMLDPLTGRSWMLGTSMKVRVAGADVALGRIDFDYMVE